MSQPSWLRTRRNLSSTAVWDGSARSFRCSPKESHHGRQSSASSTAPCTGLRKTHSTGLTSPMRLPFTRPREPVWAGDHSGCASRLLDRTLVYTALTRGVDDQVVFVGDRRVASCTLEIVDQLLFAEVERIHTVIGQVTGG